MPINVNTSVICIPKQYSFLLIFKPSPWFGYPESHPSATDPRDSDRNQGPAVRVRNVAWATPYHHEGLSDSGSFPDGWASHCRRPDRPAGQIAPVITLKRPQRMPPMLQMPQMPIIDLSGFKFAVAFFVVLFSSIPFDLRGTYARKFGRKNARIPPLLSHYVMGVFFPPVTRDFIHQKSGGSSLCMIPIIFIFSCIFLRA